MTGKDLALYALACVCIACMGVVVTVTMAQPSVDLPANLKQIEGIQIVQQFNDSEPWLILRMEDAVQMINANSVHAILWDETTGRNTIYYSGGQLYNDLKYKDFLAAINDALTRQRNLRDALEDLEDDAENK